MGNNGGSIAGRAEDALEGVLLEGDASNVASGRGVVAVEEMERRGPGEKGKRLAFAWLGSRAGDTVGRWALAILAGADEDAMRVLLQGLRDHVWRGSIVLDRVGTREDEERKRLEWEVVTPLPASEQRGKMVALEQRVAKPQPSP
ncbi:hypothetical protein BHE74_00048499 [Ensete ventricosum]|nr:hypothetical protein BHE74_00048499 [Ensete ventricosum]